MSAFTPEQIAAALDAKAAHLTETDLARIADNHRTVQKMIGEFPESWAKARRQAGLLLALVRGGTVPLESRKQAAGALIYLGSPLDIVPDDEIDGFADDAAVVSLAISRIEGDVRTHCAEKDLSVALYLD